MPPASTSAAQFRTDEAFARDLDAADPRAFARELFHIPMAPAAAGGGEAVYMTGNSLGLMPKSARAAVDRELEDWAALAVDAHLQGRDPWLPYHESLREPAARLVGALPGEVVMMNSLTVNLHLLLVSFYRPSRERYRIVIEDTAFPSDSYAVASQIRFHGHDPAGALVRIGRHRAISGRATGSLPANASDSLRPDTGGQAASGTAGEGAFVRP